MGISRFRAEVLREIPFASIVAGYSAIGTPFDHPISKLFISNLTDADLKFSFQGTDDHLVLPSLGFIMIDVSMESINEDYIATGNSVYVKRLEIPTTGSVYVSAFYGKNR